jgi:hypothetical protein
VPLPVWRRTFGVEHAVSSASTVHVPSATEKPSGRAVVSSKFYDIASPATALSVPPASPLEVVSASTGGQSRVECAAQARRRRNMVYPCA